MKKLALLLIISSCLVIFSCKKGATSEKFSLLTSHTWVSDSLLADGVDASGPDGMLKNFKGEAKFNEDYSGYFGSYTGTWRFAFDEKEIVITTDLLPIPITAVIAELNNVSFKITTTYPTLLGVPAKIRMTFKPK